MTNPPLSSAATARVLAVHGERGAAWLRQLPDALAALAAQWALVDLGPPFPQSCASLVVPVERRDGTRLVLKLAPSPEWVSQEAQALAHWAGHGAVRVEGVSLSHGALLLERAVPGTPLAALCSRDDRAATAAAAEVVAQLRAAPPCARGTLPTLASWTESLAAGATLPAAPELARASREAWAVAVDFLGEGGRSSVLHGDLHHHNLLRAERAPWLAIDPKGLEGPPEAEAAALLRNPRRFVLSHPNPDALLADRLDILTDRLGDEPRRLAGWGYVLAVLAALWAFEDQEGADEVRRWLACAEALRATARTRGAI